MIDGLQAMTTTLRTLSNTTFPACHDEAVPFDGTPTVKTAGVVGAQRRRRLLDFLGRSL
jgi:hypothetical protein